MILILPSMEEHYGDEFRGFIKVCFTILASLAYSYFISANIPKGFFRLISLLPIIPIFSLLPLSLSSVHLCGITGFFISWLTNFKLLLFSFEHGPLSSNSNSSSFSLAIFIIIACSPIQTNPYSKSHVQPKSGIYYVLEILLVALLIPIIYNHKQYFFDLHPNFITFLYCFLLYLVLELALALLRILTPIVLGRKLELQPQFNEPYFSSSLQNFWGHRWNLMVTGILRLTVYNPVRFTCTRYIGKKWAQHVGILATFAVSGLMHELLLFYLVRVWPTWSALSLLLLHGICVSLEFEIKKCFTANRWQLHPLLTGPLIIAFMMVTSCWLIFPQFPRSGVDVKMVNEYVIVGQFVKGDWDSMLEFFFMGAGNKL
ncbi:hypothetical protein MKX01_009158 [Papaver californicum]|nr:hypothetical protein MKX01_009158 [Papaver californicum]